MGRRVNISSYEDVLKVFRTNRPDMGPVLDVGYNLCQALEKPCVIPTEEDLAWYWDSFDIPDDKEMYEEAIKDDPSLLSWYSFLQVYWAVGFYSALEREESTRKTTPILELIIYFSLMSPFPNPHYVSIHYFIDKVQTPLRTEFRQKIVKYMIDEDPETLKKLLAYDTIPWHYHKHMDYPMIYRLVKEELKRRAKEEQARKEDKLLCPDIV